MISNLAIERKIWEKDLLCVGVDEVGRGPMAGPFVMCGCVYDASIIIPKNVEVDDSKKLSPAKRQQADTWIRDNALSWTILSASVETIDKHGIQKVTERLFATILTSLFDKTNKRFGVAADQMKITVPDVEYVQDCQFIIKGDSTCFSIASASILAKQARDEYMKKLALTHPEYLWEKNMGYGTKDHVMEIKKYVKTKHHRKLWVRRYI